MSEEKKQNQKPVMYEIECKMFQGSTKDGKRKFHYFKCYETTGKTADLKFRKILQNRLNELDLPLERNLILEVYRKDINKDKSNRFPVYWVKDFVDLHAKEDSSSLDEYEDDLPF
jgi:hypothetical protein